jgi:hypothetical protein
MPMSLITLEGFFSYAHRDDINEQLSNLRDDLCEEYSLLTTNDLNLFIDRDGIEWGARWREQLSSSIDEASFFIPILTPRYFASPSCRAELSQYLEKIEAFDHPAAKFLILPILYVDIQADYLSLDAELEAKVLCYQYEDWTKLRFVPRYSEQYTKAINKMAMRPIKSNQRLVESSEELGRNKSQVSESSTSSNIQTASEPNAVQGEQKETSSTSPSEASQSTDESDAGFVLEDTDIIDTMPSESAALLGAMTTDLSDMSGIFKEGSKRIEAATKKQGGTKAIFPITSKMASDLSPIAKEYSENCSKFAKCVTIMDSPVRRMIPFWQSSSQNGEQQKSLKSISELVTNTATSKEQVQYFLLQVNSAERFSRSLYKPLKLIENATTECLSAFDTILQWEECLDNSLLISEDINRSDE